MDKNLKKVYDFCYDINKNISELNSEEAQYWAKVSSVRFYLTIEKILEYSKSKEKKSLRILNASGVGSGDHDLSIVKYLKSIDFAFEWDVYDSPENPYFEKPALNSSIQQLGINLIYFDYAKMASPDDKKYDIILFTEIAEHMDHSSLLNALNFLNEKLEDDGKLIITTPSEFWLISRLKILFGKEGNEFYGEGNKNLEKGVYGHIVYYNPIRLRRIVEDCGYKKLELFTFDWLPASESDGLVGKIYNLLVRFTTSIVKNSKSWIFLSVVKDKDNKYKIPFAV